MFFLKEYSVLEIVLIFLPILAYIQMKSIGSLSFANFE